jgi:hypothetical protein
MSKHEDWLRAEESGQDELAESIFAQLMIELPVMQPSAAFVDRTVHAAWRARRRRSMRIAALAAATLLVCLGYLATAALTSMAGRVAILISRGVVWLVTSVSDGARWWWIAERIASAVSDTIAAPSTAAALAAAEMLALVAIFAFQRLARKE